MENIAYCNGCPRGCPVNALHCGKGRAYLEEQHREGKLLEIPLPERMEEAQRGYGRGHGQGHAMHPNRGHGRHGEEQGVDHDGDSTDEARECNDGPDCGIDREEGMRFHADGGHGYGRRPDKGRGWRGGQDFEHDDSTDEVRECNDGPDCGIDCEAGMRFHADGGHGYGHRPDNGRGWRGGHGFEAEASDDLYALMRACGHILYHQGGRKSGQGRILRILSHCEAMSQRDLQEVLGIQTGSLSEILAKLENAGFIERERDEADRRRSVVRLTPAGRNRAEECCRNGERQDMFSALDEGQREQLKKLLTILLADWKA